MNIKNNTFKKRTHLNFHNLQRYLQLNAAVAITKLLLDLWKY